MAIYAEKKQFNGSWRPVRYEDHIPNSEVGMVRNAWPIPASMHHLSLDQLAAIAPGGHLHATQPQEKTMTEEYPSTDDQRTEVGNATRHQYRHQYRQLSDVEQVIIAKIKDQVQDLITAIDRERSLNPSSAREYSLAITKLEEAAMWAVKGLTK